MKSLTQEKLIEIREKNILGKDLSDLAKEYDTSWLCIYNAFKRRNWSYVKGLHRNKKYRKLSNPQYFKQINTPEKAYFLGLLYADGWIRTKTSTLGIKLKAEDSYLVKILHKRLGVFNKVHNEIKTFSILNQKLRTYSSVGFEVTDDELKKDLLSKGLLENKSDKEMKLPIIEDCYINSFILGFLDGDGWISITKRNIVNIGMCSSSFLFLDGIKNILISKNIRCSIYIKDNSINNPSHKKLYTLYISDNYSKNEFLKWVYKDSSIFLRRKFKKFLHANTVLNSKLKKFESV